MYGRAADLAGISPAARLNLAGIVRQVTAACQYSRRFRDGWIKRLHQAPTFSLLPTSLVTPDTRLLAHARTRLLTAWTLCAALLVAACGGGNPVGTDPVEDGGFSLVVGTPTPASVEQGSAASSTVTITRTGNFTDPVSLQLEGVPNNVTAALGAASLAAGVRFTSLSVDVAMVVAPGSYPITVRASAAGQTEQTAS